MTEFLPDDDENIVGPNVENALFIGRVPISVDGIVYADVYAIDGETPHLTVDNFNIQPLETLVDLDKRSEAQRLIDDVLGGIQPLPEGWTFGKETRGPYYGLDQLYSKFNGMKSAWHLIKAVYMDTDEFGIAEVYYVEIGDS